MVLWFTFSYSPIAHMVWFWPGPMRTRPTSWTQNAKAGLIWQWGALDFAGGTVVHINAGVAGLVGAYVLGKRIGYGKEAMAPHNLHDDDDRRVAAVDGLVRLQRRLRARAANGRAGSRSSTPSSPPRAPCCRGCSASGCSRASRRCSVHASGAVAGLVAITPAAGNVGIPGAFVIGIAAGVVCLWRRRGLKKMLGADDSLDVFGVHCVGGIVGALLTGVFNVKDISGTDGDLHGAAGRGLHDARRERHRQLHHPQGDRPDHRPARHRRARSAKGSTSALHGERVE